MIPKIKKAAIKLGTTPISESLRFLKRIRFGRIKLHRVLLGVMATQAVSIRYAFVT